eukprot:171771_1
MAICWTVICLWIATNVINTRRAHETRFIINDNTNELGPPTSSVSLPSSTIPQIPNIPPLPDGSHTHNDNKTNADSLQTTTPNNNDGNHDNSKYVDAKLFNRNIRMLKGTKVQLRSIKVITPQQNLETILLAMQYIQKIFLQT